jgi:hypothetical protein
MESPNPLAIRKVIYGLLHAHHLFGDYPSYKLIAMDFSESTLFLKIRTQVVMMSRSWERIQVHLVRSYMKTRTLLLYLVRLAKELHSLRVRFTSRLCLYRILLAGICQT